jgi:hypothetical protein
MDLKQIETELRQAADGLLMMSETDAPFEFYHEENSKEEELNQATVLKMAGMPADYPLQVVELEHFFRNMTHPSAESGEDGRQQARRFEQLQKKLRELLQDVKVYRIGETQIMVLILGRTPAGEIAGLKTMLVET